MGGASGNEMGWMRHFSFHREEASTAPNTYTPTNLFGAGNWAGHCRMWMGLVFVGAHQQRQEFLTVKGMVSKATTHYDLGDLGERGWL
jgi:hypothetical protein